MKIYLIGIGMGNTLTLRAQQLIENADVIIGAKRMLESINEAKTIFCSYKPDEIKEYLRDKPFERVCILLSGDTGFYSGAKKLVEALGEYELELVAGISSVAYFFARLNKSWENTKLLSLHGRNDNVILYVKSYESVFVLLNRGEDIKVLCEKLCLYNMGNVVLHIGENLSYENEKITICKANEINSFNFSSLCVVLIENKNACNKSLYGLKDEEFIRGNVPMTKGEVRALSISRLELNKSSVLYDIGAGTGSVAVESALKLLNGKVYAVEKNSEAIELIKKNKIKFGADNLEIIEGVAPQVLESLPTPTHAFVGGSCGNLKAIIKLLFEKNNNIKIVVNAIALDTVAEIVNIIRDTNLNADIACVNVSKNKAVGNYQLMLGQNPVYIVSIDNTAK